IRMCAVNSEGLSDRFLDYAASIIIIAKIRDRIICDKSGVLNLKYSDLLIVERKLMSNIQPQCNKRKRRFYRADAKFPNIKEIEKMGEVRSIL
ncbi:MAG: hypothetical protein J7L86_02330, partial [Candidatus Marinimicrobia bacterium]|nr:hypothetical protein [Candidatus Neomarinimicrobiota bacterium]